MTKTTIEFLGVVGSMAIGSNETYTTGGDSICTAISSDNFLIFLDAGSGIRKADRYSEHAKKIKKEIGILLTHIHTDHYVALPFCPIIYDENLSFEIASPDNDFCSFPEAMKTALAPPYFPIDFTTQKNITWKSIQSSEFKFCGLKIISHPLNHPGGALGYKIFLPNKKVLVYVSDNEPTEDVNARQKLIEWIKNADYFIHDAHFSTTEYRKKKGWGHSPYIYPIELGVAGKVKNVVLYHHNPFRGPKEWQFYRENVENEAKNLKINIIIAESDLKIEI